MIKALLLNGSPRGKKSTSAALANYLINLLKEKNFETKILTIRSQIDKEEKIVDLLNEIIEASIVILLAPLYDDCQPYNVIKIQEIIFERKLDLSKKVFLPIINSGFPEPAQITEVAIPIYKQFASQVGFIWGGSLAIGGGEMLQGRYGRQLNEVEQFAKNVIEELEKIAVSLLRPTIYPETELILVPRYFYKWPLKNLVTFMNNIGWKKAAEEKGEKVDATPLLEYLEK
jgi:hypothetical protein